MTPSALVLPGLGVQHLRMVEALPNPSAILNYLDAAEAFLGRPVARAQSEGPESLIAEYSVGSALVYLCDWAWGSEVLSAGVLPVGVAGYGVGEVAALALTGAISPGAGLRVVLEQARTVVAHSAGSDGATATVLGLTPDEVASVISGESAAWVSAIDAPTTVRIGGSQTVILGLEASLRERGATRFSLGMQGIALGTPYLDRAAAEFAALLDKVEIRVPRIPVICPTTGVPTTDPEVIRSSLSLSLSRPSRWAGSTEALAALGAQVLVECGPGGGLSSLASHHGYQAVSASSIGVEPVVALLRSMV